LRDLQIIHRKLKDNGILIGSGYGAENGVKNAVDRYCSDYNQLIIAKSNDKITRFAIQLDKELPIAVWERHSIVSTERIEGIINSLEYIGVMNIPGIIVSVGAETAGNILLMIMYYYNTGRNSRSFYIYETSKIKDAIVNNTSYEKIKYFDSELKCPDIHVALLYIETNDYTLTKRAMKAMLSCVMNCGVVIVDKYWEYGGAKRAFDEYLSANPHVEHYRMDHTALFCIKP
jgi:hypothetical protein